MMALKELAQRVKSWFQPAITTEDIAEFDAAMWRAPATTTSRWQEYAAWTAAGRPDPFRTKTLPDGTVLALTPEEYELSQGFQPTEEQMRRPHFEPVGETVKIHSEIRRTKARVVKVIDGDTITVNIDGKIHTVRYLGVDTPETVHPTKGVEPGGPEASAANKQLVAGKTVYLEGDVEDTGKYGRLLRHVFLEDDTFVNAELVRLGHARVKHYRSDTRYKELLEGLLEEQLPIATKKEIGTRESRYMQMVAEWREFKTGELRLEQPTSEQRMESWRRAGELDPYHQKVYRDDEGKMLGIITMRPDELGELAGFKPSEAQKVWAFRETRKMRPLEQFGIWANEQVAEREREAEQDTKLREELAGLYRGVRARKGEDMDASRVGCGEELWARRREIEEALRIGVDS